MNILKTTLLLVVSIVLLTQCKTDPHAESTNTGYAKISGKTMGTTYSVTYQDPNQVNYKPQIDSILVAINQEVSTYIDNSDISLFNLLGKSSKKYAFQASEKPHFRANLIASQSIFEQTNGYFDPTVMPLVNYWGFGYTEKRTINKADETKIAEILNSVGYDKVEININDDKAEIIKSNSETELDFSAIAKGYAVDVIGKFLVSKGIENLFVEIGGETFCKGKSMRGDLWALGINTPSRDAKLTDIKQVVRLTDKGLATSGNYRNYHTAEDGSIYAHTINPKTGFPEKSNLLSATVIADDCMTADAFATAFMVMGKNKAIELAEKIPSIEIFLIYGDEDGKMETFTSDGFLDFIEEK
ncbi:MAG: FAD:protein FMN transferase [Saprospiraceae bacterium]